MKRTIRKAFKFKLNETPEQSQKMLEYAGANRFVWNKLLRLNLDRLANKHNILWYQEMDFWVKQFKRSEEYSFLARVPSQTFQQKLRDLEKAFKDGFDKSQPLKRIPTFKKKGDRDSFRYPQGFKLNQKSSRVFLPKIGWVRYRNSRDIEGVAKNVTVSHSAGKWYLSVQVEMEINITPHPSSKAVGIDMGVAKFITLSDGSFREPLNSFRVLEGRLKAAQKRLSKKVKFSQNWRRQKLKVSKIHEKIANSRRDFLQKESTEISKNHAMIFVEDLKVKNMSRSAKGTIDKPGKNIKSKSGLNKSILDQGWGMFVEFLSYKQDWAGGQVVKVPPHYTSQTCPECNHVSKENRKTQSSFNCVSCAYSGNADHVAAMNILALGHKVLACGEGALASSAKQELVQLSN